jgi:hypothetical protein
MHAQAGGMAFGLAELAWLGRIARMAARSGGAS